MNKTLVVVPTYNERENLPALCKRLLALPTPVDLLVVDDNSPDGTGKLADEWASRHPSIHVLHRQEKGGLGRAYIAGFKWALEHGYEFVFELDGDLSHNPDDIPMFLEAAKEADLVLGSRYLNGIRIINWPLSRLMLSKGAAKYVQDRDRHSVYRPDRRLQVLPPARPPGARSRGGSFQRVQLPNRNDPQVVASRDAHRRSADHFHRPLPGAFQDVRPHHSRSLLHGLAPAHPKQIPPPAPRAGGRFPESRAGANGAGRLSFRHLTGSAPARARTTRPRRRTGQGHLTPGRGWAT